MPKRVGFLYEKTLEPDFIRMCILKACKHKMKRRSVRKVAENIDLYVEKTKRLLEGGEYVPTIPKKHVIYDVSSEKEREIQTIPFWPDAIIHWILVEAMKPVLMRGMCHWSCASLPGRGCARVRGRIKSVMKRDVKGTKYAAELDVKKYYPSISVPILMRLLERKIKDKKFLGLVRSVFSSCGDTVAIGFYLNQWLSNYYLEPLDHYILSLDGVKYMTRHMDNIVLFGPNKKKLHSARRKISEYISEKLQLRLKENWQVFPTKSRGVSAVGYRFFHDHIVIRKRNFLRMIRQCRRVKTRFALGRSISFRMAAGLLSRIGQLKHCDGLSARQKYVDPIKIKRLKEVVSRESKKRSRASVRFCSTACA